MKVSYKLLGVAGWTVLLDDSAGTLNTTPAFAPSYRQQVLEVPLFNSPNMARAPLGNIKCAVTLAVEVAYQDNAAALASARLGTSPFAALLGQKFHLMVQETYGQTAETQYYPNAVLESYSPAVSGSAVKHSVSCGTDQATVTAPST